MPRGTKAEKERKRRVVAEGIVAGKSSRAIAAEAGCDARHVQRLAEEPATQFLVTDILRPHRERLARLAATAVTAVARALVAKDGKKADHIVRLRAIGRYGQLLELAQGGKVETPAAENGPMVTWEEFVVLYRSRKESTE